MCDYCPGAGWTGNLPTWSRTAESRLSRLADSIEATQLDTGREVLRLSRAILQGLERPTAGELFYVTQRLTECLTDALRVAESRGLRVPAYEA